MVSQEGPSESGEAIDLIKNQGLSIAFLAVHNRLTGGAKIFFEHANQLYRRGVIAAVISRDEKPSWMTVEAPWIQLPNGIGLNILNGLFDVAVGMFWTGIPELLGMDAKVKVLLEQGDPSIFEPHLLPEKVRRMLFACYTAPVGMITVSHKLSSILAEKFGRRSVIIPNAIDHSVFTPSPKKNRDHFTVILVGADEAEFKGIQYGLSAIERLWHEGFPIEVIQVTPGGRTLYQTKRRIVVRPSPQYLAALYREADVYLGCSLYESFSLPPLEAMACGTPVVSTDNGGIREYAVPEENCLLAPVKDVESLARQLERVLTDADLRSRLVTKGLETAQRFTWSRASEAFAGALLRFSSSRLAARRPKHGSQKIDSFHRVAGDFLQMGNLEVAKELLRTALVIDPYNLDSLYNLAYVYAALHEDERSISLIQRILEIDPSHQLAADLKNFLDNKRFCS